MQLYTVIVHEFYVIALEGPNYFETCYRNKYIIYNSCM